MERHLLVVVFAIVNVTFSPTATAQRTAATINDSYNEAVCRKAYPGEVTHWMGRKDWQTKQDLVNKHRDYLRLEERFAREAVINGYRTALGMNISGTGREMQQWLPQAKQGLTCSDMMVRLRQKKGSGQQCFSAAECTSGNCLNGVCSDLKSNGQTCFSPNQCMSGNCVNQVCTDGRPNGAACDFARDCASGNCFNRVCTARLAIGQACFAPAQCSSGYCLNSRCAQTKSTNEPCSSGRECTSGFCENRVCRPRR